MPTDAPALMRDQAELQDLRWIARHMLESHDRSAARLAASVDCLEPICFCSLCRHARPWVSADLGKSEPSPSALARVHNDNETAY
jgi:hypothetical protein